jgi:uncharacterized membrane protein YbhN (UPF0104 family)
MNRALKLIVSLGIAALFMWLAFRNVEFGEIIEAGKDMKWGWIPFFVVSTLTAHFIRAERWRMLFNDGLIPPKRWTLFTGVMFGYLTNIPFPRLGEVTRPIYVARNIGESNSRIIGTIVLERLIDVLSMLLIMAVVGITLVSDPEILSRLFGVDVTDPSVYTTVLLYLGAAGALAIAGGYLSYRLVISWSTKEGRFGAFALKVREVSSSFFKGVLAVRSLKNWPLFVLYTALIWLFYILMMYIPFWMFDLQEVYTLTFTDAIVLTMVSAVGISIPTPGGVGSYHLFITYSLLVLYAIPESTGLAFATITHAATLLLVIATAPICLAIDKYVVLKEEARN